MPTLSRIKDGNFLISGEINERIPVKFNEVTVEAFSCGFPTAYMSGKPFAVLIDGISVISQNGRGITITRLNEFGTLIDVNSYDTHNSPSLGDDLAVLINDTPNGWVIIVNTLDQPSFGTISEWDALRSLGFTASIGSWVYRCAFVGVCRKGFGVLYEEYSPGDGGESGVGTGTGFCSCKLTIPAQIYFPYDGGNKNSLEGYIKPSVDQNVVFDDKGISVEEGVTNLIKYGNSFDAGVSFWRPHEGIVDWANVWDSNKHAYRIGNGISVYKLFSSPIPMPDNPSSDNSYTLTWEHLGYLYYTHMEYTEDESASPNPFGSTTLWKPIPKELFTRIDNFIRWERSNPYTGIVLKSVISPYRNWTKEVIVARIPATAKFVRFHFDGYNATTSGSRTMGGWIRKISFNKKTFPTTYVDGSRGDGKLTYQLPIRTPLSVVIRYNLDGTSDGQDRCIFSFDNDDHTFNTFSLWRTRFNTFRLLSGQSEASFSEISIPNNLPNGDHTFISTIDANEMALFIDNIKLGSIISPKLPGTIETFRVGNGTGLNLIRNGNAQMGNNTNFLGFKFITGDSSDGDGKCFEYDGGVTTIFSDDMLPIDSSKEYFLSADFKETGINPSFLRFGIVCFDKNMQQITHPMVNHSVESRTTLAQDLNPGDTVVHLSSISGWWTGTPNDDYWHGGNCQFRKIAFYDNNEYLPYTYTRNCDTIYSTQDIANNTLTLRDGPWSGSRIPAGTPVANSFDGPVYNYTASAGGRVPSTWTTYSGRISGEGGGYNKFRYGTKYVKLLILPNYWEGADPSNEPTGKVLRMDNVKFYEVGSNCFANSPIRYASLYNKTLNPAALDKLGIRLVDSAGDMNSIELCEELMNIPPDVYHFPLDCNTIEKLGGVKSSSANNVLYEGGSINVGRDLTNLLADKPIESWTKRYNVDINKTIPMEYDIFFNHINGWEQLYIPVSVIPGNPYVFQFDLEVISNPGLNIQILSEVPTDTDCSSIQIAGYRVPSSSIGRPYNRIPIRFTPTTNTVYLCFNFGYCSDSTAIRYKIRDIMCIQNNHPIPFFTGVSRGNCKLQFNFSRDIGLDWNGDWTIGYFKKPVGTDVEFDGHSVESIGKGTNTTGKTYFYIGKQHQTSNIVAVYVINGVVSLNNMILSFDADDFFMKWHMIVISKSGTTIRARYIGDTINGDTSFNVGLLSNDCFLTPDGFDFNLGGYNYNNHECPSNSYFKDLFVAKRCLSDDEIKRISDTQLRIYNSNKIQTKGLIGENNIL